MISRPAGNGHKTFYNEARPDGFEPPTTWFEGLQSIRKILILLTIGCGTPLQVSRRSTTNQNRLTQKSRNYVAFLKRQTTPKSQEVGTSILSEDPYLFGSCKGLFGIDRHVYPLWLRP